jgi:hypothetical protein
MSEVVLIIDFSCGICGKECPVAPDPPEQAICAECCDKSEDGHDYEYDPWRRGRFCLKCDAEKEYDPY